MIIKELFEGPVGDYCIAHNTIKCLWINGQAESMSVQVSYDGVNWWINNLSVAIEICYC